jgi:hypothetical protein
MNSPMAQAGPPFHPSGVARALPVDRFLGRFELHTHLMRTGHVNCGRCPQADSEAAYFIGIGVARSTGTAATLFCGEPSITRSE